MRQRGWAALLAAAIGWAAGGALAAEDAAAGKAVYDGGCIACHGTGVLGAPKLGDAAAWRPRAAGGLSALVNSARAGKGSMPPKGGNAALSDDQLGNAISYMVGQSGGFRRAGAKRRLRRRARWQLPARCGRPRSQGAGRRRSQTGGSRRDGRQGGLRHGLRRLPRHRRARARRSWATSPRGSPASRLA